MKRFSVEWTPGKDSAAWLMFTVHKVGIVNLVGITLIGKP